MQEFIASQSEEVQTTYSSAFNTALNNINSNLEWYGRSFAAIGAFFEDTEETTTVATSSSTTEATTTAATTTTTTAATAITTTVVQATTEPTTGSAGLQNIPRALLLICFFKTFI